jgi:hypothetical protein
MTNKAITHRIARYVALPIMSAGLIGGAALGGRHGQRRHIDGADRPGLLVSPNVKAKPAAEGQPRLHGVARVEALFPATTASLHPNQTLPPQGRPD